MSAVSRFLTRLVGEKYCFDLVCGDERGPTNYFILDIIVLLRRARLETEFDDTEVVFRRVLGECHPRAKSNFSRDIRSDALIEEAQFRIMRLVVGRKTFDRDCHWPFFLLENCGKNSLLSTGSIEKFPFVTAWIVLSIYWL